MDLSKLVPYQRTLRPVGRDSLPQYLDVEFQRISVVTTNIVQALRDLDARISALEAP